MQCTASGKSEYCRCHCNLLRTTCISAAISLHQHQQSWYQQYVQACVLQQRKMDAMLDTNIGLGLLDLYLPAPCACSVLYKYNLRCPYCGGKALPQLVCLPWDGRALSNWAVVPHNCLEMHRTLKLIWSLPRCVRSDNTYWYILNLRQRGGGGGGGTGGK